MKEKTKFIVQKIDKTDEVKRLKILREKLNNNDYYLNLMNSIVKEGTSDNIIDMRKKLFAIPELKEYLKLQNQLRLLSISINNIIISVLN
ncbi:MAG: hypothetical protein J6J17_02355 [Bacilli bacterium]|nr:hypothetical protein [Bacilli bacterium]